MASDSRLDRWVEMQTREWPEFRSEIVHGRRWAEGLVLRGSPAVAARAAALLLDHGPLTATSRAALAARFPEQEREE